MGKKSKRKPAKKPDGEPSSSTAAAANDPLTARRLAGGCLHGGLPCGPARDVRLQALERFRLAYTTNQPPPAQDRRYYNQGLIDVCLAEAAECALVYGVSSLDTISAYMNSATALNEMARNDKSRVNYSNDLRNVKSAGNIVVLAKLIPCDCLKDVAEMVHAHRTHKKIASLDLN